MLIIVRRGHEGDVAALFERWEVPTAIIGRVTEDHLIHIRTAASKSRAMPVEHRSSKPPSTPAKASRARPSTTSRTWICPASRTSPWDARRRAAPPPRQSQHHLQALDLPPVRPERPLQHRRPGRRRRCGPPRSRALRRASRVTTDCNGRYCHHRPLHRRAPSPSPRPLATSSAPALSPSPSPTA